MSYWPSPRDFDGKPILGFIFEHKMPDLRERKKWVKFAYEKALEFIELNKEVTFIAEDFTIWYEEKGFPPPHSNGCWGAIWRKLFKHGMIQKTETRRRTKNTPTATRRRTNKQQAIVWRAKNV